MFGGRAPGKALIFLALDLTLLAENKIIRLNPNFLVAALILC